MSIETLAGPALLGETTRKREVPPLEDQTQRGLAAHRLRSAAATASVSKSPRQRRYSDTKQVRTNMLHFEILAPTSHIE